MGPGQSVSGGSVHVQAREVICTSSVGQQVHHYGHGLSGSVIIRHGGSAV